MLGVPRSPGDPSPTQQAVVGGLRPAVEDAEHHPLDRTGFALEKGPDRRHRDRGGGIGRIAVDAGGDGWKGDGPERVVGRYSNPIGAHENFLESIHRQLI